MTEKTKKDILKDVQNEQLKLVANIRLKLLAALEELDELSAEDSYLESLTEIVRERPGGTSLSKLRLVFPDAGILNAARKTLENNGSIKVEKDGASVILKPSTE